MAGTVRYAITDLAADDATYSLDAAARRRSRWAEDLRRWTEQGVDFVQLREKELEGGEVFLLATSGMAFLRSLDRERRPKLLINGRPDLAVAARADGVHLTSRSGELLPGQVREVFLVSGLAACTVSVSCHSVEEAARARDSAADLILFGPVFEKRVRGSEIAAGKGLETLHAACQRAAPVPVIALGGVDQENAPQCLQAGAAGVAGIRLFGAPRVL